MNTFVFDTSFEELHQIHSTEMAQNQDPTVLCLVYEFFQSQFALQNEVCPLNPDDYIDNDILQNNDYPRISNVLRTQGQICIDDFRDRFDLQIQNFLPRLQPPNGATSFNTLSNHFFTEGINWNHILTYFVFSAELAYHANLLRLASVNDVAQWLVQYTSERLLPWINENGGWMGIIQLEVMQQKNRHQMQFTKKFVYTAAMGLIAFGLFHLSKSVLRKCVDSSLFEDKSSVLKQQVLPNGNIVNWFLLFNWIRLEFVSNK